MIIDSADIKRVVMVRLNPGEEILDKLQEAVKQEKIQSGIIMNGLGSVQRYKYHVVADQNLPPLEAFPAADEPRDILAFSGIIINGRVHAHITLSDSRKAEGGHLEPGTKVLTFTMVFIAEMDKADFTDWDSIQVL